MRLLGLALIAITGVGAAQQPTAPRAPVPEPVTDLSPFRRLELPDPNLFHGRGGRNNPGTARDLKASLGEISQTSSLRFLGRCASSE